jgi:hypothetical protein
MTTDLFSYLHHRRLILDYKFQVRIPLDQVQGYASISSTDITDNSTGRSGGPGVHFTEISHAKVFFPASQGTLELLDMMYGEYDEEI